MDQELEKLHHSLENAMNFLDETYEEATKEFDYNGYVYLFIENRRAELIDLVYKCFDESGSLNGNTSILSEGIQKIKNRTLSGLRHMFAKIADPKSAQLV